MSKHIGIPIKVLHDAEGHTVTVELKNGEVRTRQSRAPHAHAPGSAAAARAANPPPMQVYRGKLDEAEDNMNVHLSNCTKTMKDGKVNMLTKCAAPLASCTLPPLPPPTSPPPLPAAASSCAGATCASWCCPIF